MRGWPLGWENTASARPNSSRSVGAVGIRPTRCRWRSGFGCGCPGRASGLTAQASTFARHDVLDALAKQLPAAVSAAQALAALEELADDFLGSERAVLVTVDRGLDEPRYSTPELLNLERGLVDQVERRADEHTAVVAGEHVRTALRARPGLDADQQAIVRQVTGDGAGISLAAYPRGDPGEEVVTNPDGRQPHCRNRRRREAV